MLKLLSSSSSCLQGRLHSLRSWPPAELGSPVLRVLGSLAGLTRPSSACPAFYSSDSGDGSDQVLEVEFMVAGTEAEAESSSAIVSTNPRPEDYLTVIALPLPHRPLFPGFYMPIYVKDPQLLAALQESRKRQAPYAGAFLLKDKPGTDPSLVSGSETDKNIHELKGKELFNRLHEVGTLAQISSIQGDQVVLIGHRRLRITEMVDEEPLTVKVDHLKDKPYNKDDHVIDATSFELTLRLIDHVKTCSNWLDHVKTYTQEIGDLNIPWFADFGAAISGANKLQSQEVLEELDVHKRLKLTLELVKKDIENSKIQDSIEEEIEENNSLDEHLKAIKKAIKENNLLSEQLKDIKRELGLETDDKTTLTDKFREMLEPNRENCPPHVLQVIEEELTKLHQLEAGSSAFNLARNYLDWLTSIPWGNYSAVMRTLMFFGRKKFLMKIIMD